jgi:integrase
MKRRARGDGGLRKRVDGRWEGTISLGWQDGRRIRLYVYGRTRQEAREKLLDLQARCRRGELTHGAQVRLGPFLDRWLDQVIRPHRAPGTYRRYEQICRLYLKPALGELPIDQVTTERVQALLHQATRAKGPGVAHQIRHVLRAALSIAVEWRLAAENAARRTTSPTVRPAERRPLTPEQCRTFLHAARGHRLEACFALLLALGLRPAEAVGLSWEDVDLDRGLLAVRQQVTRLRGQLLLRPLKTARARRLIRLPRRLADLLAAHRARQDAERASAGDAWQDNGLVFCDELGGIVAADRVTRAFQIVRRRAGLPPCRLYDLRHTAASYLLASGVPMRAIADLLGHSTSRITADVYAHVLPTLADEVVARIDAFLGEIGGQTGGQLPAPRRSAGD